MTFLLSKLLVLVDHLAWKHWFSLLPPQIQQLVFVNQVLKKGKKSNDKKKTTLLLFADCELQVKKGRFSLCFYSLTTAEQANSCKP